MIVDEAKKMKLIQVAKINSGYPFRGKIPEVVDADAIAVQMKDVSPRKGINWSTCLKTRLKGRCTPDWLRVGDILFAARGSHNDAVLVSELPALTLIQAVAAPHFYVIRCVDQAVLPEYLAWLLNQGPCQQYFEQQAEGSLTKSIRRSVLENTPIVIPPLKKQQAIIRLASMLQQEHDYLEQLIQNGKNLLKIIFTDLFKKDPIQ